MFCLPTAKTLLLEKPGEKVLYTLSDTHDQYKLRFHITKDVVCCNLFFKKLNKTLTIDKFHLYKRM